MTDEKDAAVNNEGDEEDAETKAEALYQDFIQHPAFAKEIDPSKPMSTAFQGMQALKYEENDPHLCAMNYKEEGNHYFGRKKYDVAVANYDRALEKEFDDEELKAVLLTNRATCNFYLKNYRRCINDCKKAKESNPAHIKIYRRAAMAAKALGKTNEGREWVEDGLKVDKDDEQLRKLLEEVMEVEKKQKMERRRLKAQEWKDLKSNVSSFKEILKKHEIRYEADEEFRASLPSGLRVWEDDAGHLHWPVMLLYPESGNTDLLQDVVETTTLRDCMEQVFGEHQEPPSWDLQRRYSPETAEVYFEHSASDVRLKLNKKSTLEAVTRLPKFLVQAQLLCFVVISTASEPFYSSWVK